MFVDSIYYKQWNKSFHMQTHIDTAKTRLRTFLSTLNCPHNHTTAGNSKFDKLTLWHLCQKKKILPKLPNYIPFNLDGKILKFLLWGQPYWKFSDQNASGSRAHIFLFQFDLLKKLYWVNFCSLNYLQLTM